eukprot:gb/GFBE01013171.1/.p1 GENE.gb/GFBE01013171.1/~~gb/GFBE01013171.1/.p1  ORF type:complete len:220 (+),score=58.72 gb/GFBE01013171.1/:1-660(+)
MWGGCRCESYRRDDGDLEENAVLQVAESILAPRMRPEAGQLRSHEQEMAAEAMSRVIYAQAAETVEKAWKEFEAEYERLKDDWEKQVFQRPIDVARHEGRTAALRSKIDFVLASRDATVALTVEALEALLATDGVSERMVAAVKGLKDATVSAKARCDLANGLKTALLELSSSCEVQSSSKDEATARVKGLLASCRLGDSMLESCAWQALSVTPPTKDS